MYRCYDDRYVYKGYDSIHVYVVGCSWILDLPFIIKVYLKCTKVSKELHHTSTTVSKRYIKRLQLSPNNYNKRLQLSPYNYTKRLQLSPNNYTAAKCLR